VNHSVIYSASIVFEPRIQGKQVRAVEFSNALHVSDLRSNLLSCLHLTCNKEFEINIFSSIMIFKRDGNTLFNASIDSTNSAIFSDITVASELFLSICILPVNAMC